MSFLRVKKGSLIFEKWLDGKVSLGLFLSKNVIFWTGGPRAARLEVLKVESPSGDDTRDRGLREFLRDKTRYRIIP